MYFSCFLRSKVISTNIKKSFNGIVKKGYFLQTRCSRGCSINSLVTDSLIQSVSEPVPQYLHNIINHKQSELVSWNFERMFIPQTCHVSHVTCHMSHVTCHVSHVTFFLLLFFCTIWWSLSVEGLLSTGPTPSSFGLCHSLLMDLSHEQQQHPTVNSWEVMEAIKKSNRGIVQIG